MNLKVLRDCLNETVNYLKDDSRQEDFFINGEVVRKDFSGDIKKVYIRDGVLEYPKNNNLEIMAITLLFLTVCDAQELK